MSYTKKQLTAFREILSFCPEDKYAIHTTSNGDAERYIVTDGSACVVLVEKPEGFPMKDDGKFFYDFCEREQADGDHQLVEKSCHRRGLQGGHSPVEGAAEECPIRNAGPAPDSDSAGRRGRVV